MKEKKILYQIRLLEKMIFRNFIANVNDLECNGNYFSKPTPTQMQIMEYIMKNQDKDIYQKDLEQVLKLRRATVSGVLQTMEKNNLIVRVTADKDTRTKKIILNEKTKEIFNSNKKKFEDIEDVIIKDIPESDIDTFLKVIELMKENIEKSNVLKEGVKKC